MSRSKSLKRAAEMVRRQGGREDKVLAHISPAEAKFLKAHFGGDKNPKTGLPQYGLFKSLKKLWRHPKKLLGLAGSIAGNMIMPGAGAIIGGALGQGIGGKGNLGKNLLKGALMGGAYNYLAPQVGGMLGVNKAGTIGKMMGVGAPSLLNTVGVPNLIGQGGALSGLLGGAGTTAATTAGMVPIMTDMGVRMMPAADAAAYGLASAGVGAGEGLLGGILGGGSALDNMMKLGAMGAIVQGVRKGKSEYKPYEGPTLQQRMLAEGMTPPVVVPYSSPKPILRKRKKLQNPNVFSPELLEEEYFEPLPWPGTYAQGGEVHNGYFHGASGGQDDNRHTEMPERSYVQDATTISLYGDGNSEAGKHRFQRLKAKSVQAARKSGYKEPSNLKMMEAMVSDGEDIWTPEEVFGFGVLTKGDGNKGVKAFDEFRKNLRKQKGVDKFLPPKSKSIDFYIKDKRHGS